MKLQYYVVKCSKKELRSVMKDYPFLSAFSKDIGIPPENLAKAFEYEKKFHENILKENDFNKRQAMYEDVYNFVHELYGNTEDESNLNNKYKVMNLFKKELSNKSILDIGCGKGNFLLNVEKNIKHKRLVGVDVSDTFLPQSSNVEFIKANILDFDIGEKFDIIISDNVLEHISPNDMDIHLKLVKQHLKEDGIFIALTPNRLFGPHDVTRIVDYTYSNQIKAMGTHLNEMSYGEAIKLLKGYGFKKFNTVIPLPVIKYKLPNVRITAALIKFFETKIMLKILYKLKYRQKSLLNFPIFLVCKLGTQ